MLRRCGLAAILLLLVLAGCRAGVRSATPSRGTDSPPAVSPLNPETTAGKIVLGARREVERAVRYDASYQQLSYPNGDVPSDRGACCDVIVRALRFAGYDLQELIHKDKASRPAAYPIVGGSRGIDTNIDHRRVVNQLVFLKRYAQSLTTGVDDPESWPAGDLVYWDLGGGIKHCGVVSNLKGGNDLPYVIHNIGPVTREEDALTRYAIIGHFRYPPARPR